MSWGELTTRAEALLPGPELVALLASIEAPADPVWLVGQWNRVRCWVDAQSLGQMAPLVSDRSDELDWRGTGLRHSTPTTPSPGPTRGHDHLDPPPD